MDLNTLLSALRTPAAFNAAGPMAAQAEELARMEAQREILRRQAYNPPSPGSIVGGHYVPNFQGLANQFAGAMLLPGAERDFTAARAANQGAQQGMLRNAIASMPEAPGDTSNGPPIPGALQDQMQAQFAADQLIQNPMTEEIGTKILSKALGGGFAREERARADEIAERTENREFRLQQAKQAAEDRRALMEFQFGERRALKEQDAAFKAEQARAKAAAPLSPKDTIKIQNDLGNRMFREGKDYGEMVDAIDRVESLLADNIKSGKPLTASQADAAIYAYNKVLDPTSVVREGEYARTTGQNPTMDRVALWLNQVKDGKVVATPELAKQMLGALQDYSKPSREKLYQLTDNYAEQARQFGVSPGNVVTKKGWRNPANLGIYEDNTPVVTPEGTSVAPGLSPMPNSYKDPKWDDLERKVSPQYAEALRGIRLHGERSNANQVSSADARTPYQITSATRRLILDKYGFDAWDGPENAIKGAAIVYQDGLNKGGGDKAAALDHYSGGAKGYAGRVLQNTARAQVERVKPTQAPLPSNGTMDVWKIEVE